MPLLRSKAVASAALLSFLAFALALVAGCGEAHDEKAPATAAEKAAHVRTVTPEKKVLHRQITRPAYTEAFEETPLFAHIPGYVLKVHVDMGYRMKGPRFDDKGSKLQEGDVLAELWVPELVADRNQKQAKVKEAGAQVDQAREAVAAAAANVTTALALVEEAKAARTRARANHQFALSQYQRVQKMGPDKLLADQVVYEMRKQFQAAEATVEEVEAKVRSAAATAEESEAKHTRAKADFTAAQAHVEVAQADVGRAAAMLGYSKIHAPYNGVVTRRQVNTGSYLTGNAKEPLFLVARMDVMRLCADVPEADATFVKDGKDATPARISFLVIKDQQYEAKVARTSWSLDPRARTLRAEIDLDNRQQQLRPGMYANVTFSARLPEAFTLPAAAVVTQGEQHICFRVVNGKVVRTPITVGVREEGLVQVFRKQTQAPKKEGELGVWEDFTAADEIILTSPESLTNGQAVVVERKKA